MTTAEWEREARRLQYNITRYDTKARRALTLADRLQAQATRNAYREMLRQHRLNYHGVVTP